MRRYSQTVKVALDDMLNMSVEQLGSWIYAKLKFKFCRIKTLTVMQLVKIIIIKCKIIEQRKCIEGK